MLGIVGDPISRRANLRLVKPERKSVGFQVYICYPFGEPGCHIKTGNGYLNTMEKIKEALYELFGDVPIATNDSLMEGTVGRLKIQIVEVFR